jgi:lysophospholipase L1-like esterase
MKNTTGRRGSCLGRVFMLLITTLITLGVLEIVLRTFFPVYQVSILQAYQYDPELGTRLHDNVHLFKTTDFQQEIRTNPLGTVNFQDDFKGYDNLVFAVGDSFTQGTGLPSDMSYPAQLDLILNQDENGFYQKKYGVVNLGIAASGGEQALISLQRWAGTIGQPKVILYLGCANDYEDDTLFKNGFRHKHIVDGSPNYGPLVRPLQWLTDDLQIGIRLKIAISNMRRMGSQNGQNNMEDQKKQVPSIAELERPVFDRMLAYAKENNAELIVGWSDEETSYEWLKKWAADNNVKFADWAPKVKAVESAIPALPEDNNHSGGHHRGWVNHVIAEEYARQIRH